MGLLSFLIPDGFTLTYESGRNDIKDILPEDCLFLVLCRMRHNFGLKDIAVRFGLTLQSSSVLKLGFIICTVNWDNFQYGLIEIL